MVPLLVDKSDQQWDQLLKDMSVLHLDLMMETKMVTKMDWHLVQSMATLKVSEMDITMEELTV